MIPLENVQMSSSYNLIYAGTSIGVLLENLTKEPDKYIYHFSKLDPRDSQKEMIILDSITYGNLWYLMEQ